MNNSGRVLQRKMWVCIGCVGYIIINFGLSLSLTFFLNNYMHSVPAVKFCASSYFALILEFICIYNCSE